jgi:hypothetical protein
MGLSILLLTKAVLFKITLTAYGYTLVAKGTMKPFALDLRHGDRVYRRLEQRYTL